MQETWTAAEITAELLAALQAGGGPKEIWALVQVLIARGVPIPTIAAALESTGFATMAAAILYWSLVGVAIVGLAYDAYLLWELGTETIRYMDELEQQATLDARVEALRFRSSGVCDPECNFDQVCSPQNQCVRGAWPGEECAAHWECLPMPIPGMEVWRPGQCVFPGNFCM